MTPKIKKIIAREGLVLSILLAISIIVFLFSEILEGLFPGIPYYYSYAFRNLGWFLIPFGYPIYLLIRFVIWATRTLKER